MLSGEFFGWGRLSDCGEKFPWGKRISMKGAQNFPAFKKYEKLFN